MTTTITTGPLTVARGRLVAAVLDLLAAQNADVYDQHAHRVNDAARGLIHALDDIQQPGEPMIGYDGGSRAVIAGTARCSCPASRTSEAAA